MNYDAVRTLIATRLATVSGLPTVQAENGTVSVAADTPWCRLSLMNAEPAPLSVGFGGMDEHRGLLQVCLFYPQDVGAGASNAMSALIQAALPRGTILTGSGVNVHVNSCWQETAYRLDRWYCVPVTIRWASYYTG